jgi:hypothetical protein
MTTTAYHGDEALRTKYIDRANAHREADDYIQAYGYWCDGKGCTIGCLAHSDDNAHAVLEKDAGLPEVLNHLADVIFEGLPDPDYKTWAERYASAPRASADLSKVHHRFLDWLLSDELPRHFDATTNPDVAKVSKAAAELHRRSANSENVSQDEWAKTWADAEAAVTVRELPWTKTVWAARAALAATKTVASATAATALWASCAADEATEAAPESWSRMADKLVEFMADAPVVAKGDA